jgi:hypothetical protein
MSLCQKGPRASVLGHRFTRRMGASRVGTAQVLSFLLASRVGTAQLFFFLASRVSSARSHTCVPLWRRVPDNLSGTRRGSTCDKTLSVCCWKCWLCAMSLTEHEPVASIPDFLLPFRICFQSRRRIVDGRQSLPKHHRIAMKLRTPRRFADAQKATCGHIMPPVGLGRHALSRTPCWGFTVGFAVGIHGGGSWTTT